MGTHSWNSDVDPPAMPLERDINIAVNGCSGFATSTQIGPFTVDFKL